MTAVAYGVCVGRPGRFSAIAEPSIRRCDPDAVIITRTNAASLAVAYNSILDEALERGITKVVLLHEDVELIEPKAPLKLAQALASADVALVGVIGGRGTDDMPWWTAEQLVGRAPDGFWQHTHDIRRGEVDAIDGLLLGFSEWAVRHLRFDVQTYPPFHGYDADICRQARAAAMKVLVEDVDIFHHTSTAHGSATPAWHVALYSWRLKWRRGSRPKRALWRVKRRVHSLRLSAAWSGLRAIQ